MKISPQVADIYSGWAEEHYNPQAIYHNWSHAEEVMTDSLALVNEGGRWTRHVNRPLLQIAAAWHDAGIHDGTKHTYASDEHYAVALMRQRLVGKLPERQLKEIEESILGTQFMAARNSMAAIALHYGDVGNMFYDRLAFTDHVVNLWAEQGKQTWQAWRHKALHVIEITAAEAAIDLPRIGVDESPYLKNIYENFLELSRMSEPK